jgi:hypothetical protein
MLNAWRLDTLSSHYQSIVADQLASFILRHASRSHQSQ